MTRQLTALLGVCLFAASCADSAPAPTDPETSTRSQSVVDDGEPNWMVVGGAGLVEMVGGSDGEPDALAGRFALEGSEIIDAVSGADRWIVAGPTSTQPLDNDALRLTEARAALSGDAISFIARGDNDWLIGGANGRVQRLDAQGEPTASEIQVLGNSEITAAAFNGTTWLVGSAAGAVVPVNKAVDVPAAPDGQAVGSAITAIASEPTTASMDPPWLAFTATTAVPISGTGVPQTATTVLNNGEVTTAQFADGKVYIGTSDGRVGVADYNATPTFSFSNVLGGAEITRLVSNGTDWIALGANGQAQRFDNSGASIGSAVQVAGGAERPLVGAHWTGTDWLIVVGSIGFVAFADDQLAARELTPVLGGAQINDASASAAGVLVVGNGGAVQLLDELGAPVSTPATAAGGANINAAAWNGDHWLVGGAGGAVQVVDAAGAPSGSSTTTLDGEDIEFISWSGEFFVAGGRNGKLQFLRGDGSASAPAFAVDGVTQWHAGVWSGLDWLIVGTNGTNGAIARVVATDTTAEATILNATSALRAVDFNGIEFLAGGDNGLVQRVSAQGVPVDTPNDVLTGFDIRDLYFNGSNYIVAGEFGAIRRLGQDYAPLRTPIAVLEREDATAVLWTRPRGFASGACITNELCYEGPCVGGLANGQCCDSACDRACESCFENDTGEPDGTCAPVVAGKQPPVREGSAGCDRQAEGTCGLTGSCDGAGECEFYGAEIECAESVCSLGRFTPVAACTGSGMCENVQELDCAPYAGCTDDGCVTSCNADQDCVDGFGCAGSACIALDELVAVPTDPGTDEEEGGCCATTSPGEGSGFALMLIIGGLIVRRRR